VSYQGGGRGLGQTAATPETSRTLISASGDAGCRDGVVRLAGNLALTSAEVCALLGDVSERTWFG